MGMLCLDHEQKCFVCPSDATTVKTWDFSEANEVQERLDALRAARYAQRAQRRERGGRGSSRKTPRFPPAPASNPGSADEQDADMQMAEHDSKDPAAAASPNSTCSSNKAGSCDPWHDDSLDWRDLGDVEACEGGRRARIHCHSVSLQPGWSEHCEAECSCGGPENCLSRSLPVAVPRSTQEAASFVRSPPWHAPPPLQHSASTSASEADSRRNRMTSWDILRPRSVLEKEQKGSRQGIKVGG